MHTAHQIVLASRPIGEPILQHFRLEAVPFEQVNDGEVGLRVLYLSLDPYMRGRMSDAKSYVAAVPVNGVMDGETICEVTSSKHSDYRIGDVVRAQTGWRTHATLRADLLKSIRTDGAPLTTALGVLGMPGFTAYSGMKLLGQPKPGETVVVAAASGPVGSLVGQLAKLAGARTVGIAGGPEKCGYAKDELGFDFAIDHRSSDFASELEAACSQGIDVYFENVGGHVWDAVLPLLNRFSRVPVSGLIANYNDPEIAGPDKLPTTMNAILRRSILVRGFINYEFENEHYDAFLNDLAPKVAAGEIKYREDIVDGLDRAPGAFIGMLRGKNFGKLLVKVAQDL